MQNAECRMQADGIHKVSEKNIVKLSPRLQAIANKVIKGSKVADIGTDHAYIPIYLIQNAIAEYAIASDVRKGPLQKAKQNIIKHRLEGKIGIRLGDGLEKIYANEVDTVIIAGMGGVLITEILSNAAVVLKTVNRLILQPMIGQEEVRKWLESNQYTIIDEELTLEGEKIYNIIVAEKGYHVIEDPIFYYIGKKLIENKDPLLIMLLNNRINELKNIIAQLMSKQSDHVIAKLEEYRKMLFEYEKIKQLAEEWRK